LFVALAFLFVTTTVHAGRPMTTDDADIRSGGQRSLQSWWQRQAGTTEHGLLPACKPWHGAEFAVGPTVVTDSAGRPSTDYNAQAKVHLFPDQRSAWCFAPALADSYVAVHSRNPRQSSRWLHASAI
jgi:hypothetical protein